jgi:hypothetical protein
VRLYSMLRVPASSGLPYLTVVRDLIKEGWGKGLERTGDKEAWIPKLFKNSRTCRRNRLRKEK